MNSLDHISISLPNTKILIPYCLLDIISMRIFFLQLQTPRGKHWTPKPLSLSSALLCLYLLFPFTPDRFSPFSMNWATNSSKDVYLKMFGPGEILTLLALINSKTPGKKKTNKQKKQSSVYPPYSTRLMNSIPKETIWMTTNRSGTGRKIQENWRQFSETKLRDVHYKNYDILFSLCRCGKHKLIKRN